MDQSLENLLDEEEEDDELLEIEEFEENLTKQKNGSTLSSQTNAEENNKAKSEKKVSFQSDHEEKEPEEPSTQKKILQKVKGAKNFLFNSFEMMKAEDEVEVPQKKDDKKNPLLKLLLRRSSSVIALQPGENGRQNKMRTYVEEYLSETNSFVINQTQLCEIIAKYPFLTNSISEERIQRLVSKEWPTSRESVGVDDVIPIWESILVKIEGCSLVIKSLLNLKGKFFDDIVKKLEDNFTIRSVQLLETVFTEGKPDNGELYFVYSGRVKFYKQTPKGQIQVFFEGNPGFIFGDITMFVPEPYHYTCCSTKPNTSIIVFSSAFIKSLFSLDNNIFFRLIQNCFHKIKSVDRLSFFHVFALTATTAPTISSTESDISNWSLKDILSIKFDTSDLNDQIIELIKPFFNKMYFSEKRYLTRNGLNRRCEAYIILKGRVNSYILFGGQKTCIRSAGVGDSVGLSNLLSGIIYFSDDIVSENSILLAFPRQVLRILSIYSPEFLKKLVIQRVHLAMATSQKMDLGFHPIEIDSGYPFVKEGEFLSENIVVLITGRILEKKGEEVVNTLGPGEILGVKTLLTGKPYKTSLVAARDTELIAYEISPEALGTLLLKNKNFLEYTLFGDRENFPRSKPGKNVCFLTTITDSSIVNQFITALKANFFQYGSCKVMSLKDVKHQFQWAGEHYNSLMQAYARSLEKEFDYVLYVASFLSNSEWRKQTLRQADVVVVFEHESALSTFSRTYYEEIKSFKESHYVLLHNIPNPSANQSLISSRIGPLRFKFTHPINISSSSDIQRLARIITGHAIGLVLSGGASKALAHIGVIQALRENGIPIDIIGGVSAGSLVAALTADNRTLQETATEFHKLFTLSTWYSDLTFPWISFLSGTQVRKFLKKVVTEANIQDLPLNFFTLSTNMITYGPEIHRTGEIWLALRASSALPPLLPPVRTQNSILVDGGFVNNTPTDVARNLNASFVILSDVGSPPEIHKLTLEQDYVDHESGMSIFLSRIFGLKRKTYFPSLISLMSDLSFLVSWNRQQKGDQTDKPDILIKPKGMEEFGVFCDNREAEILYQRGYAETCLAIKAYKEKLASNPSQFDIFLETPRNISKDPTLTVEFKLPQKSLLRKWMRSTFYFGIVCYVGYKYIYKRFIVQQTD